MSAHADDLYANVWMMLMMMMMCTVIHLTNKQTHNHKTTDQANVYICVVCSARAHDCIMVKRPTEFIFVEKLMN